MAVDFASKQRDREGAGWGLRNAKLRMSRKLIFAAGLLVCFSASLDPELKKRISTGQSTDDDAIRSNLANHIRNLVMLTPLEVLERSVKGYGVQENVATDLFGAYGEFLSMLADDGIRKALGQLRAKDSRTDPAFKQVRKMSERFEKALDAMFFENALWDPSRESTVSSDENNRLFHWCARAGRLSTGSRNAVRQGRECSRTVSSSTRRIAASDRGPQQS